MSITNKLASAMAGCKRAMADTIRDMSLAASIGTKRHDDVARQIAEIDAQPPTPENQQLRAELSAVRSGLHAGVEYSHGVREQATGKGRPERHGTKDAAGQFTKPGTIGHQLADALNG